ncbi:MAG: ribosome biogenesis GTPase Der [Acidobacteria bacterium]|nr:ribosome biogenesis GTPase Der [Acidobacteriota bacterium]
MPLPVVAIVGAPNAGKSTLFNRLLGRRKAIVAEMPGVTRDRITGEAEFEGRRLILVDTGGLIPGETDDLTRQVRNEALKAADGSDLILFVIDARAGITAIDLEVAGLLRSCGRPVLSVANKIDAASVEGLELDLYRLGLGEVIPLSAEQGRGLDLLVERVNSLLPESEVQESQSAIPLALIGRPNVGKSSLFNRIVGEERSLVDPQPGTTRDPVDATFTLRETCYRIIDTAGIRRRAQTGDMVEWVSVVKARQALDEAQMVIVLVDISGEISHQDQALLGLVAERRTPAILALNKIDLLADRGPELNDRIEGVRDAMRFSSHVPVVPISVRTGEGIPSLLDRLEYLRDQIHRRFTTAQLNRALNAIVNKKHPPSDRGRPVRFFYMTQVGTAPPRFMLFSNGGRVGVAYRRFLVSQLRDHLGLDDSPLALRIRRRPSSR